MGHLKEFTSFAFVDASFQTRVGFVFRIRPENASVLDAYELPRCCVTAMRRTILPPAST